MASDNQIAANRENATHSTGPRTESGKDISSRNNFRHGLASNKLLIEGEDPEEYEALLASFVQLHQPANGQESDLVASMAQHRWLSRRAICLQNVTLTKTWGVDEKSFALYMRYQTNNDRGYAADLKMLLKFREQLAKELIGFESQEQKKALNDKKIQAVEKVTNAKIEELKRVGDPKTAPKAPLQPPPVPSATLDASLPTRTASIPHPNGTKPAA